MEITAIIPARYSSTRFEGKPLASLLDKPMIQHVYERCLKSSMLHRIIVATDDERIYDAVKAFKGEVVMTSSAHETGTDRLAEVASSLASDIIVNVQGDEPLIQPAMINEAIKPLADDRSIMMGTLKSSIKNVTELNNPSVVKVVVDKNDYALYFSRFPIPFVRDESEGITSQGHFKHIGLYVYDREFLIGFSKLKPTPLEKIEKLEQLRVLENGYNIKVVHTELESIGVDTPEDLIKARQILTKIRN